MNNEATNVDHIIKVCLAAMEAKERELKPNNSAEISIRKYLKEGPTATIKVEDNRKLKPETLAQLKAAAKRYNEENGDIEKD